MKQNKLILMLFLIFSLSTMNVQAKIFDGKTVGGAELLFTTGDYKLDDASLYSSGNGYDISSTDNYLRSYDLGYVSVSFVPREVGKYQFSTTVHAPGSTEPAVDDAGDYKYEFVGSGSTLSNNGATSTMDVLVNDSLVNSSISTKVDEIQFYNVVNNEIVEFTTVITSPSGTETVVSTDASVDADYYTDYDLTASAATDTFLELIVRGSNTPVPNPTGDASLGSSGIMLTAGVNAGVKGPNGTKIGSQEIDSSAGFSQDFKLSAVNNTTSTCSLDPTTVDYYLVDEALINGNWQYETAQTGNAASGSAATSYKAVVRSNYNGVSGGAPSPARDGSDDRGVNQTIAASALQGDATDLLTPWSPSGDIHVSYDEFTNSQDIENGNKIFASTQVQIWIPLLDALETAGCDEYSFTFKVESVPGTAEGTAIDGSPISEGTSVSDTILIQNSPTTVKPSPEVVKKDMYTDLVLKHAGGALGVNDIANGSYIPENAAGWLGNGYSQPEGRSYYIIGSSLSMKTLFYIGESENGYELLQKWDPIDFEYFNKYGEGNPAAYIRYAKYDSDPDSPTGYSPYTLVPTEDYTTEYGYLPAGETSWESYEQMYYDDGKDGSSYLEWSETYDDSRTIAGVKVNYDKEITIDDYTSSEGVTSTPAIKVNMYTPLKIIDPEGTEINPTQVSASQTINTPSEIESGHPTYPYQIDGVAPYQMIKYGDDNYAIETKHMPRNTGSMSFLPLYSAIGDYMYDDNGLSATGTGGAETMVYKYAPGEQDLELDLIGKPVIYKYKGADDIDVIDEELTYYIKMPQAADSTNDYQVSDMQVGKSKLTADNCVLPIEDGTSTTCSYQAGNILNPDIRSFEVERIHNTSYNQYVLHFKDFEVPDYGTYEDVMPLIYYTVQIPYIEVAEGKTVKFGTTVHAQSDYHSASHTDTWQSVSKTYELTTLLVNRVLEEAPQYKKADTAINYTAHFQRDTNDGDKTGYVLLPTNGDQSGSSFNGDYTISNFKVDGTPVESAVIGTDYSSLLCSNQSIADESMINYDVADSTVWTDCDGSQATMLYIDFGSASDLYNYVTFDIIPTGNQVGDVYKSKAIYPNRGVDLESTILETLIYDESVIELTKVDDSGAPIEGVSFDIKDADGNIVQTITTDSEGHAQTTPIYITTSDPVVYDVIESDAPVQYVIDSNPYSVILDNPIVTVDGDRDNAIDSEFDADDITTNDPIVNTLATGKIELNKVDQFGTPIEGVEFGVYSAPYASGATPAASLITDAEGYAITDDLPLGDYVIKELSVPTGYQFDPAVSYTVNLSTDSTTVAVDGDNDSSTDTDGDGDKVNDPIVNKLLIKDVSIDKTSTSHVEGTTPDYSDTLTTTNQLITYVITIDNTGTNYDLSNVTVTDLLDDDYLDGSSAANLDVTNATTGLKLVEGSDYTFDSTTNTITLNTLEAESLYEISFDIMTTSVFDDSTTTKLIDTYIDNKATVTVDGEEQTSEYHIPINLSEGDVTINKEFVTDTNESGSTGGNGLAGIDEVLTYKVTVTNGDIEQSNVVITDRADSDDLSNLSIIEVNSSIDGILTTDAYTVDGNTITLSSLAPNEEITITYTADVAPSFADSTDIANEVCLSTDELLEVGVHSNCSGTTTTKEFDGLVIDKTSSTHVDTDIESDPEGKGDDTSNTSVSPAQDITYVITLDNTATSYDHANVTVTDLLDDDYLDQSTATNVVVTNLTTDTELVAGTDYSIDDSTNTITINNLEARTEYQITFDVTAATEFDDSLISRLIDKTVDNTVTVTVDGESQEAEYHIPINLADNDLTINKAFVTDTNDNGFAGVDEILTYAVTVTNGDIEQSNVVIADRADSDDLSNLSLVEVNSSIDGVLTTDAYTVDGNTITLSSLAPNEEITITYTADVASSFADTTDITNEACLSTDELIEVGVHNKCSDITTPKEIDGLVIDKTSSTHVEGATADNSDDKVSTDEMITYVITLDNTATSYDQSNVTVTDLLDDDYLDQSTATNVVVTNLTAGTELVAGTDYSIDDDANTVTINNLEAGTEYQITFDVMTASEFDDSSTTKLIDTTVDNTVTVTVDGEEQTAEYHIPINLVDNDLTINKEFVTDTNDNGFAGVDETLTYAVTVTNGDIEQSNVVITDTPDSDDLSNLSLVEVNSSIDGVLTTDAYTVDGNTITLSSLAPNEEITITYTADVASSFADTTDITNEACLTSDELSEAGFIEEDYCSTVTTPKEIDGLVIDKTSSTHVEGATADNSDDKVSTDEMITYVITLDNTTTSYDQSNVTVTDLLDDEYLDQSTAANVVVTNLTAGTELVAGTDYSIDDDANTVTINNLEAGTEYQITFDVMTASEFDDSSTTKLIDTTVDNTVTVTVDGEEQTAEYHIPINLVDNDLTINKEFVTDTNDNGFAGVDETLTYAVTVTSGDIEQSNVVITDTLDSDDLSNLSVVEVTSSIDGVLTTDAYTVDGNTITLSSLAPNEEITITYTADVASMFTDVTDITNDVCLTSDELAEIGSSELCSTVATPKEIDGLVIDKTSSTHVEGATTDNSDDKVSTDEMITYVITLDNTATNYDRSDVIVTDLLDDEYLDQATATNVVVTNLTTDTELVAGTDYSIDDEANTVTINNLEAGTEYQITFDVMTASEFDDSSITKLIDTTVDNTVTVAVEGKEQTADYHIPINLGDIVDPSKPESNVSIAKALIEDTNDNGLAGVGEVLTYEVTVINGDVEQSNVVITDTPDSDDLTSLTVSEVTSSTDGNLVSPDDYQLADNQMTIGSLAPNEEITITYNTYVSSGYTDVTDITNDVCLTSDELVEIGSSELCSTVATPKEIEGLVIDKTSSTHVEGATANNSDDKVSTDEMITYVITLDNTATNYDRSDVTVTDLLDDEYLDQTTATNLVVTNLTTGTELVAGTDYSIDSEANTVTINNLEAGTEYQLTFDVMTASEFDDSSTTKLIDTTVDNTVTVTVDGEDHTADYHIPINLDVIVDPSNPESNITITKEFVTDTNDNGLAGVGEVITYKVTVTNGDVEQSNVVITDTPDSDDLSNLTVTAVTSEVNGDLVSSDDYQVDGNVMIIGSVAPNDTIEITYTLEVASEFTDMTAITNDVCLISDELTLIGSSDLCSTVATEKEQAEEIIVDKPEENVITSLFVNKELIADGDNDQLADVDELLTYQVTVENTSSQAVSNVVITDTPDAKDTTGVITNVKVSNGDNQGIKDYTVDGNVITISEIKAGDAVTITYDVQASSEFAKDKYVSNTVTVTDDNDSDVSGDLTEDVKKDKDFGDMSLAITGTVQIISYLLALILLTALVLVKRLTNIYNTN